MKGNAKSSYKINLEPERNKLYNREPVKNEKSKRIRKEREHQKMEKIKQKKF